VSNADSPAADSRGPGAPEDGLDIFDVAPVGMSLVSTDRRYVRVNRRYEEIVGHPREYLLGLSSVDDIVLPADLEAGPPRDLPRLLRGEIKHFSMYKRYVRGDGAIIWGHLRVSLRRAPDGRPLHMVGVLEDVTAQLEAKEKLELVAQQDLMGLAVFQEHRLVYANDAATALTGYDRAQLEALIPEGSLALVHPDDRARIAANARRRDAGQPVEDAYRIRGLTADGGARWVDVRVRGIRHAGLPATIVAFTDASEHVAATAALEAKGRRYEHLLRTSKDGIHVVTLDGSLREWNDAFREHLGYDDAELAELRVPDWDPNGELELARGRELTLPGGDRRFETRHRRKDGAMRDVEIIASRVQVEGEELLYCSARDITERKRAEQQQRSLEEQLRVSQKMEALGRVTGGVAHDFNNLLTVIQSYAELTAHALAEGSSLRADVEEIRRAAERAAWLTRQLLAFSRKSVVHPEVLDLGLVVSGVEKMLRRLIGEDVELAVSLARTSPVLVDRGQIEQVLLNLAVNARDAMPDGGQLSLSTRDVVLDEAEAAGRLDAAPGTYVRLTVADTGVGMDEPTLSRIFEPFFTTKEAGKGTGLGLATVYGIVRQSHASIRVRSEVGRGTTFEIDFPALAQPRADSETPRAPSPARRGHESVLVVEDEPALRAITARLLTSAGYDVQVAADATEADARFEERGGFDLLVTDVVMPGVNGRQLARRLRARVPSLCVLFMSGYSEGIFDDDGALDDVQLLPKPFSAQTLGAAVRSALDRGR
jgi:PAS domain S-box-containing protein